MGTWPFVEWVSEWRTITEYQLRATPQRKYFIDMLLSITHSCWKLYSLYYPQRRGEETDT